MGKKLALISFILGVAVAGAGVFFWQDAHTAALLEAQTKKFEQEKLQADLKISNLQSEFATLQQAYDATQAPQTADPTLALNGTFRGYIEMHSESVPPMIEFDSVQFLSGADGTCTNMSVDETLPQCNPNGYDVVNADPKIYPIGIRADIEITMQTYAGGGCDYVLSDEIIDLNTFNNIWSEGSKCIVPRSSLYDITIEDGEVVEIIEFYTP